MPLNMVAYLSAHMKVKYITKMAANLKCKLSNIMEKGQGITKKGRALPNKGRASIKGGMALCHSSLL
jgi:hypothetical protein